MYTIVCAHSQAETVNSFSNRVAGMGFKPNLLIKMAKNLTPGKPQTVLNSIKCTKTISQYKLKDKLTPSLPTL